MQTMRVLKFGYTAELKFDDQERTLDISMEIQGINHEFTELSVDHRSALTAAFLLALKRQVFRRIFFIDFPEVLKVSHNTCNNNFQTSNCKTFFFYLWQSMCKGSNHRKTSDNSIFRRC